MGKITTLDAALAATEDARFRFKVDEFLADLSEHPDIQRIRSLLIDPKMSDARKAAVLTKLRGEYISDKAVKGWRLATA